MASLPATTMAHIDESDTTRNTETTVNDSLLTSKHEVHKLRHDENFVISITRRTSNRVTAVCEAILKEVFNPNGLPPAIDVFDYVKHADITPPSFIPPAEDVFDYCEPIKTPTSHLPPAEDVFDFKKPD